jgi:hypothetical protein
MDHNLRVVEFRTAAGFTTLVGTVVIAPDFATTSAAKVGKGHTLRVMVSDADGNGSRFSNR